MALKLIKSVGFTAYIINIVFNLFRKNYTPYNLHFTSVHVKSQNIRFFSDFLTLKSFSVSGSCYFQGNSGIYLGRNFLFASGVKIISSNHDIQDHSKNVCSSPVIIGDNVWLGVNVIILPGVVLGNNTVVGAGSVVTKSFLEGNCVLAGNPAKIIKILS